MRNKMGMCCPDNWQRIYLPVTYFGRVQSTTFYYVVIISLFSSFGSNLMFPDLKLSDKTLVFGIKKNVSFTRDINLY